MTELEREISERLRAKGISPHRSGFDYLLTAINLVYGDRSYLRGITKCLYPEVAVAHDTTNARVERSMRSAIEASGSKDMNAVFIANIVEDMRCEE